MFPFWTMSLIHDTTIRLNTALKSHPPAAIFTCHVDYYCDWLPVLINKAIALRGKKQVATNHS